MQSTSLRRTLVASVVSLLALAAPAFAQKVFTVAGGYVGDGKPSTSAALNFPSFAAYDSKGDLFVGDNCRLRKVDNKGIISTVAGTGICGFSGDGGPAIKAKVSSPTGIAVDSAGDIFFADYDTQRVRKIDSAGTITTIAGNGKAKYCGDGKPAVQACLNSPEQLAIGQGRTGEVLYIADNANQRIRQVALATGIISTLAGNGTAGYGGDGGPAKKASLNFPFGVAFYGKTRTVWISDTLNFAIRQVNLKTGIITTFLGNVVPGGLTIDASGNLHVADDLTVLGITVPGGNVTVDVGVPGAWGFNGDGIPATYAFLSSPTSTAMDPSGNVITLDAGNSRVRKGSVAQNLVTVAGGYLGDGKPGTAAALNQPQNVAFDHAGSLYIADTNNHRIRKVDSSGKISTFAGDGISGFSGDGGPAQKASLNFPAGVAADPNGNVYIADSNNLLIRKVDKNGVISTFAVTAILGPPQSMATDKAGNLFVATQQCLVAKFAPDGTYSIVAGVFGQCGYNSDGIPATQAELNKPYGVTLDSKGNLYIGDTLNFRVRMVDGNGIIHTVAGNGTCGFSGDGGPGTTAMLCWPEGVGADGQDNLYIADSANYRVRMLNTSGTISTIAGTGKYGYNGNGLSAKKTNIDPYAVAVSPSGKIYIADPGTNNRIRRIQ